MAREGQGLQILVIIFVFLTMILAFGTWWGISNWATTSEILAKKEAELKEEKDTRDKSTKEAEVYRWMVGFGNLTEEQARQNVAELTGASADEVIKKRIEEVDKQFAADMQKFEASHKGEKNWRALTDDLLAVITKKNRDLAVLTAKEKDLVKQRDDAVLAAITEKKNAEAASEKFQNDFDKLAKDTAAKVKELETSLAASLVEVDKQGKATEKVQTELTVEITDRDKKITQLEDTVKVQAKVIRDLQPKEFDVADGRITLSSPTTHSVWINLGSADNLRPQITFAVYGPNVTNFIPENKKADIQVLRIVGPHQAQARVVADQLTDPILIDDLVHTPAWTPARKLQFALAGFFDLDGDLTNDQARFKSIMTANNGDIVAELTPEGGEEGELTPRIRYLIVGDPPTDPSKFALYNKKAEEVGLEVRYYRDVLEQMGVREEAKTTRPSRDDGDSGFSKRRPPRGKDGGY